MAAATASNPETGSQETEEHGFNVKQGVDWSKYVAYRPIYPASFFQRIYDYHAQKPNATWSLAHDIGAGAGIVSAGLAKRFDGVVVSDPNDGYVTLARELLIDGASLPESKFRFLQEGAEKSSVESGITDLITVCECIHWMAVEDAIEEFNRELRPGGTVVVTHYNRPLLDGNERAQRAWTTIWEEHAKKAQSEQIDKALSICNTALDAVGFPGEKWESVRRVYVNAQGTYDAFKLNHLFAESRVKEGEEQVWEEGDEDWWEMRGIEWLKKYHATWVPFIPESEFQDLWDELERALGGKEVRTVTPVVLVLATKKA